MPKIGYKQTIEHRRNLGIAMVGKKQLMKTKNDISKTMMGRNRSEETKNKISETMTELFREGKIIAVSGENHSMYGKKRPLEIRKKISKKLLLRKKTLGYINSFETRRKIRISTINYRKINGFFGKVIGKNEKQILDELQKSLKLKIIRQYSIIGYFVDGYIKELNLVIEVDERYHRKNINKDKVREADIKQELNCGFVRIQDY